MLHRAQEVIDPVKPCEYWEKLAALSEYETWLLTFDAFLSLLEFMPEALLGSMLGEGRVNLQ